jgi:hypothetical protein
MHPKAEYMNPIDLAPCGEHLWSREVNRDGLEAWIQLVGDVAVNGFREPAVLEYNPETGQGYLGEGNHRLGVALELGIPLPVVVQRTRKTTPAYPMKQVTEPGRYSVRDERGFSRFPRPGQPFRHRSANGFSHVWNGRPRGRRPRERE